MVKDGEDWHGLQAKNRVNISTCANRDVSHRDVAHRGVDHRNLVENEILARLFESRLMLIPD